LTQKKIPALSEKSGGVSAEREPLRLKGVRISLEWNGRTEI